MVNRNIIINKITEIINNKLNEWTINNPLGLLFKPTLVRIINNNIYKIDNILKLIADKDDNIDIENILNETANNLVVAQMKKYPDILGGLEVGNGTIKLDIPYIDMSLVFDSKDIESLKQTLIKK